MPIASANARPRIMFVWIAPRASGLRPSASIALLTSRPMPSAGAIAPTPIAKPAPRLFIPLSVIWSRMLSSVVRKPITFSFVQDCRPSLVRPPYNAHAWAWCASRSGLLLGRESSMRPRDLVRLFVMLLLAVVLNGRYREDEGEQRKDRRLNKADERLQTEEHGRDDQRCQKRDKEDHHVAGEDVAKKTEGETDDADKLRQQLKDANEDVDRIGALRKRREAEELAQILVTERRETPELDKDRRPDRDRERRVGVAVGAAEERPELDRRMRIVGRRCLFIFGHELRTAGNPPDATYFMRRDTGLLFMLRPWQAMSDADRVVDR